MKKVWIGIVTVLMFGSLAAGADVQQVLKNTVKRVEGAICLVDCKININGQESSRKGVGVCIDAEGLILTKTIPPRTKADSIKSVELVLPGVNGKRLPAEFLGMDSISGVAFLRAREKHAWSVVSFQKSANVSFGDLVVSVGLAVRSAGTPLVLGMGYISADQRIPQRALRVTGGTLTVLGSVVFNAEGRAIGLVTSQPFLTYQEYRRGGNYQALLLRNLEQTVSFTPVDEFVEVLTNIPQGGVVRRPSWIGAFFAVVPETLREAKGLTGPAIMLDQVMPGGAADQAGLKDRSIVVGLNGAPLESFGRDTLTVSGIRQKVARLAPGTEITFTVLQKGQKRDVKLKIQAMPIMPGEAPKLLDQILGLALREKIPYDRAGSDPNAKKSGMIVLGAAPNSPADRARLRKGDLVTAIDGKTVTKVARAEEVIKNCLDQDPPKDIEVTVLRGTATETLTIRAPGK